MRLTQIELGLTLLVIGYIAFYTHPVPNHISDFLSSPVGSIVSLLSVLYVTAYQSFIVGIFLAIAYLVSVGQVTEYLDEKEQKPEVKQPTSNGVAAATAASVVKELTKNLKGMPEFKGDTKLPIMSNKKGMQTAKPAETTTPKPAHSNVKALENFSSF
jgi:hypothetical protein